MPSIKYEEIFSRFYTKVEAYDLTVSEEVSKDLMINWLHSAVYNPYVNTLFSTLTMTDESTEDEEGNIIEYPHIEYTLDYVIDENSDKEFLKEVLSYGMALAWLEPKVNSLNNLQQFYGTNEVSYFSQANHITSVRAMRDDLEYKIRAMVRDRGYAHNDYLDGNVKLRKS